MCGIFGVVGHDHASEQVFAGLKRLEYRGYDSWGVATWEEKGLSIVKAVGALSESNQSLTWPESSISIGHTRWATHGAVTKRNAHPHLASDGSFALAQNGIVENFEKIKQALIKKGYTFRTETDTEAIVYLIEEHHKRTRNIHEAIRVAFKELDGRNTIIVLTKDKELIAVRNGSPLVLGKGKEGVWYLSSDELSLSPVATKRAVLHNGEMISISQSGVPSLLDIYSGKTKRLSLAPLSANQDADEKGLFKHYMQKEIFDTPEVLRAVIDQEKTNLLELAKHIKKARYVFVIGSGTAGLAAAQIAYYLRTQAGILAISIVGAEGLSYKKMWRQGDLIIAPSQSGETADVLEVLEQAKADRIQIASYVNMPGSLMTAFSDFPFMARAGAERCVMSTKVFTSQIAWGYLLALAVSGDYEAAIANLRVTTKKISDYLKDEKQHRALQHTAKLLIKKQSIFLLGKGQCLEIMREGMVKIIEGTYLHAHALPAGDLKHYAITIMEKGVPVLIAVPNDESKEDVLNAAAQVKTRGAMVIGMASSPHTLFSKLIPTPDLHETFAIGLAVVLQLLAYYMTVELKHPVDKPRNIAKSVTVK